MALVLVLGRGIEPLWCHHRRILSPLRLPVPPPEQKGRVNLSIIRGCQGQDKKKEEARRDLFPSSIFSQDLRDFVFRNRGIGKVPLSPGSSSNQGIVFRPRLRPEHDILAHQE